MLDRSCSNQTDFSKTTKVAYSSTADREADKLIKNSIRMEYAIVPYRGNDIWAGLNGKKLIGSEAAKRYASRLNDVIKTARGY